VKSIDKKLEAMVDEHGLRYVLFTLAVICELKGLRVLSEDETLGKALLVQSRELITFAGKVTL